MTAETRILQHPPGARTLDLLETGGTSDEGRAMMELIYDIAPGVNLKFASGGNTDAGFATAVTTLTASGVDIIVDDLNGLGIEPYFQDGFAAQAITTAVAGGVTFLSSTGNRGLSGYEESFTGLNTTVAGIAGRWSDFAGGDPTQTVTLQPGTNIFFFQFDDPFYGGAGVTHDADFYLLDVTGNTVLASGTDDNPSTGVPPRVHLLQQPVGVGHHRSDRGSGLCG